MAGNAFWIIIVLAVAVIAWGITAYNSLVRRRNYVEDAWAGIEVQLKKRHNLVPNLVKTIKGFTKHEADLLEKVTKLRTPQLSNNVGEMGQSEEQFGRALQGLMVQVEAYPEIKADDNFRNLQNQLSEIEGDIEGARRYYNGAVRDYNTQIQSFPSNMIADRYHFDEAEFFELDVEAARQAPDVDFDK